MHLENWFKDQKGLPDGFKGLCLNNPRIVKKTRQTMYQLRKGFTKQRQAILHTGLQGGI